MLLSFLLLAASSTFQPVATPQVVKEGSVASIATLPPPLVDVLFDETLAQVCTFNLLEEADQVTSGKDPTTLSGYAKDFSLSAMEKEQVEQYCKAYSAGAAFVVASVMMDATINDILARSKLPVTKGKKK